MAISSDPVTIPEKAKQAFSWREFGYIAAAQYCRINKMNWDDGAGTSSDMQTDFGMWHYDQGIAGQGFKAGWTAYMIEHQRGRQ